jgi:predicted nucleotidyltransferase
MQRYEGGKRDALVRWAQANPRVQRVWVYGGDSPRNDRRDTDLDVAIELAPVVDSDETLALWIANAKKWHSELEERTGTHVDLEWFDPETDEPIDASARLAYERASPDPEMH